MLYSLVFAMSIDCPDISNLAYGMNMHLIQPAKWFNLTNYDCCDPLSNVGVKRTNNRVSSISWTFLNLNGTLNATAIPSSTTSITLNYNKLTGQVPVLPSTVLYFYATSNEFTGTIPELEPTLNSFEVSANKLIGNIPVLPTVLRSLYLYNNKLNGSIPLISPNLIYFVASQNLLTGTLPTNLNRLQILSLGSNLLFGDIPAIPSTMQVLFLSRNYFSGCLPQLPAKVFALELFDNPLLQGSINTTIMSEIRIQNTSISEFIHLNTSILTKCFLNNTALLGKVDGYTQCSRGNLFTLQSTCLNESINLTSSTALSSTSIIATIIQNVGTLASQVIDDTTSHTVAISSIASIVATRLTRKLQSSSSIPTILSTTQNKSSQIGRTSHTSVYNRITNTAYATTTLLYLEPRSIDQKITLTLSLAIHLFINWGLIIFIINEAKRSYSKRSPKRTVLSMGDV